MVPTDNYTFVEVKAYAAFLQDNYLLQMAEDNLQLAQQYNLPLLKLFEHLPAQELHMLSKESVETFLQQILSGDALPKAIETIEHWSKNGLPGIPREKVQTADIVLTYSLRKKLFLKYLQAYTSDASTIINIIQELEDFYTIVEKFAFDTFVDIQKSELSIANEELKAQQEELQTLNEELRESQEQYEAVNAELIDQISHRLDIEQALIQNEARFRLLAENSSDMISTHTPDGIFTYISPSCKPLLGYTPEELLGRTPYDFIHPDDIPLVKNTQEALLAGRQDQRVTYRKITKNGRYKWFESVTHLVAEPQTSQIIELQIASRDITARKEIEASLEKERQYFKAVLENITDGIVACDEKGILSFFNKATRLFHGLPEQHLPSEQWASYYNLYYPDGKTSMKQEDVPLFKAFMGEPVSDIEMVIAPVNGKKRTLISSGTRIVAADGKMLGAVAIMHDITESKEAQDKLQRSEAMLAESQAIAHVGSWEWDIEANQVIWSDELKRIYGYSAQTAGLTYEGFLNHVHPQDKERAQQIINETFQTHQPYVFEHRIVTTSGDIRWLQARGKVIVSSGGKVLRMTGTGQDITEIKKTEEELSVKNQQLSQALEELKNAEEYLVNVNYELELKVQKRTQELQASEEELRQLLDQSIEVNNRLQESENFLSSIIDQSPVSTWIADAHGTQIRVNKACLQLFGVTDASQCLGKYNILRDELLTGQPFYPDIVAVFTGGKIAKFNTAYNISEVTHVQIPHGKPVHLVVTIFPIKNTQGEVTHAVIQHEDITQQKTAGDALRASEERYRFMAESIPHIVWTALPDGQIDYYNKRWTDYTGATLEETLSLGLDKFVHPEDITATENSWKKSLLSGAEHTLKHRFKLKDGTYRWMWTSAVALKDEHARIIKWFGTATDIHEQQLTLDALTEARKQLQFLAEFIPQIVWRTFANGNHDYFNQRWYDYTGLSYEESKNRGWSLVLHPDDYQRTIEVWNHSLATGSSYEIEYRFKRYDGVYRWFLARALPMQDQEGNIQRWFGTCTDIHDQKEALYNLEHSQKELQEKNEELKRINTDLDNFIYTASHDLKAPISNLEGLTSMLEKKMKDKTGDAEKKIMQMMEFSVSRLKRTIADLTEITKVQKELHTQVEPVFLKEVLKDVETDIALLIHEANASIRTDFQVSSIRFARKNIRSIFYNLLTNAIKYRSPDRRTEIFIQSLQQNSYIVVSFTDNGLGIRTDQLEKIFFMFKRVHTHVEGSGIGLYIVKRIIENSGGKIEVTSQPGTGTTFTLFFKPL